MPAPSAVTRRGCRPACSRLPSAPQAALWPVPVRERWGGRQAARETKGLRDRQQQQRRRERLVTAAGRAAALAVQLPPAAELPGTSWKPPPQRISTALPALTPALHARSPACLAAPHARSRHEEPASCPAAGDCLIPLPPLRACQAGGATGQLSDLSAGPAGLTGPAGLNCSPTSACRWRPFKAAPTGW